MFPVVERMYIFMWDAEWGMGGGCEIWEVLNCPGQELTTAWKYSFSCSEMKLLVRVVGNDCRVQISA